MSWIFVSSNNMSSLTVYLSLENWLSSNNCLRLKHIKLQHVHIQSNKIDDSFRERLLIIKQMKVDTSRTINCEMILCLLRLFKIKQSLKHTNVLSLENWLSQNSCLSLNMLIWQFFERMPANPKKLKVDIHIISKVVNDFCVCQDC